MGLGGIFYKLCPLNIKENLQNFFLRVLAFLMFYDIHDMYTVAVTL